MRDMRGESKVRESKGKWLATPATPAEAELRQCLDQAAARGADEVALRRVWARLSELPALMPLAHAPMRDGDGDGQERDYQHQLDELRTRRVRWPWIVAASLAGATATLAFMLIETKSEFRAGREASVARATEVNGTQVTGSDAGQRSVLVAPATVRTGFGETLHLSLRGGTEVVVTSESTLVLDQNDRPAVSAGEVQFRVPRQAAGQTFSVGAGAYRVVVVGTRFRVRVNQASAAVGVEEGVVEVWNDHRIARLSAGESWVSPTTASTEANEPTIQRPPAGSSPPAKAATAKTTKAAPGITASSLGAGSRKEKALAASSAGKALAKAPLAGIGTHGGSARLNLALVSPSSSSSASISNTASNTASATAAAMGNLDGPASTGREAILPPSPASSELNTVGAPAAAVPSDVAALTLQARAARAAGDSRRALGLYRALAQRGGPSGENAEYEIGRVLRDGLHQPREAVAAWRTYRAQHPRGLLRVEADISLIETLVALGDKTMASVEASEFIRRYPDSERRAEIARLAGDLQRERGQCGEAIRSYDTALSSAHGRRDVSDSATFHRSLCLLQADRSAGLVSLRVYVESFPSGRFRVEANRLLSGGRQPTTHSR